MMCPPEVAFPQGEEEKDDARKDVEPQSSTCTRGREAGKSKAGSFLLIWLLWHCTCCLVGLPTWNSSCPFLSFAAESGLPFPLCFTPRWALGLGGPVFSADQSSLATTSCCIPMATSIFPFLWRQR